LGSLLWENGSFEGGLLRECANHVVVRVWTNSQSLQQKMEGNHLDKKQKGFHKHVPWICWPYKISPSSQKVPTNTMLLMLTKKWKVLKLNNLNPQPQKLKNSFEIQMNCLITTLHFLTFESQFSSCLHSTL
jgi:hypothetical protein